jgi:amino acid transporter
MFTHLKDVLIGPPLPTGQILHERLNKVRALAAFSPDALSSIAYANQEIYLGLVIAGSTGLLLAWPIGIAITILLVIVAISYYQTIHAYPGGGGSYIVARTNLGTLPGLVAASALLIDYVLTAAVSLTAGVEALASAFPILWTYRVYLALVLLLLITLLNLRGLRETGTVLSVPVYLFLFSFLAMLLYGAVRWFSGTPFPPTMPAPPPLVPITALIVLHAFSAGCTALTGIESISNGIPAFRPPEARNAGRTLIVMAVLMGILFLGSIGLTHALNIIAGPQETILSALARTILGTGPAYYLVQISTLLILTVAANTSFAGFPRVAAILAGDRFLPHQFRALGERLVFANGIAALAFVTGVLIVIFRGNSHSLIPLFAVGAFMAFTLSQSGMVIHWWRERGPNWRLKSFLNGFGALATAVTLVVVGVSKFLDGAWLTLLVIPLIVLVLLKIRSHYAEVAHELSLNWMPLPLKPGQSPRIVVPISGVHRGVVIAMAYARSISNDVTAVYVELDPVEGTELQKRWKRYWPDIPLVVVPSPYRSLIRPLLDYLDQTDLEYNDGQLATVLLPEFVPSRWWHSLLHNQTAWMLKTALLYRRRRAGFQRAIIDVPFHLLR